MAGWRKRKLYRNDDDNATAAATVDDHDDNYGFVDNVCSSIHTYI